MIASLLTSRYFLIVLAVLTLAYSVVVMLLWLWVGPPMLIRWAVSQWRNRILKQNNNLKS